MITFNTPFGGYGTGGVAFGGVGGGSIAKDPPVRVVRVEQDVRVVRAGLAALTDAHVSDERTAVVGRDDRTARAD